MTATVTTGDTSEDRQQEGTMFVEVIKATVTDRELLRRQWTRWGTELEPGAGGFLGATAGVGGDGTFMAMVRFDSAEAASRNATRAEQTRWWVETMGCLRDIELHDCTETEQWNNGGSDAAGFVQIRQGVSNDPARLRDLYVNQQPHRMGPHRPEVLGGLFAWHPNGGFTLSAYFSSLEAAREGEQLDEFKSFFDDINAVMQDLIYVDLVDPWLSSGPRVVAVG
ncbi:MAG: hypothetical protein WD691_04565 [Acidimicrobiales bacterium]